MECFAHFLHVIIIFGTVMKAGSVDDQRHSGYLADYATKHNNVLVIREMGIDHLLQMEALQCSRKTSLDSHFFL